MSDMKTLTQRGAVNVLLLPLILVVLFFLGAAGFGYWAFAEREDYKNNSDQKVAVAVSAAEKRTQAADAKIFAEKEKQPLRTYVGPSQFGALTIQYPKTWSAYVIEGKDSSSKPVETYFYPEFVPNISNNDQTYALRAELVSESYDQVLNDYEGSVKTGKVTITPYRLPKVPNIVGSRIEGQLTTNKQGTMVILPLRNMTLKIWVDASSFVPDFNNIILPNITFTP
jgi:hypothetical protein